MECVPSTFHCVKEAKESGGIEALLHKGRRGLNLKNRVDEATEPAVLAFALDRVDEEEILSQYRTCIV